MSRTDHLPELESLRAQVVELSRTLAEHDQAMQDLREQSDLLRAIVAGTATDTGEEFSRSLVRHLAQALKVRYVFVGKWHQETPDSVRTLAIWSGADFAEPFEYALQGTPCANVVGHRLCLHESGVQRLFPEDHFLAQMNVDSYCGMPLFDRFGQPLGLLVVMDDLPLTRAPLVKDLMQIFAARAATELQRQQADEALHESEQRLAQAVEGSNDILWDAHRLPGETWHAPQTSIWWSPRVREFLDLEESEPFETLEQWAARLHHDDKDRVFGQLAAHIEQRAPYDVEYRLRTNRGDYRWVRGRGQAMWDEQGEPRRMSGSCQDITKRKQVEKALCESEERYRTLVDLSPNGVLVYSNGKKVYVNQAACRIMGAASPEQLLDNPTVHFSHPDDHESIHASIAQILATGEQVRRVERKYQRLDGTAVFVEVDAGRIMWNGKPAIQVIFADITERRQAEEALRKSEAQFRALAESTTDWMWEIDEQGRYTYCSPKIRDMLGYEPNDALGKTPFDFMPEEEARRVVGLFGPIAAARKPFAGIENTNRHKDGRLVILECRGTPVIDANGLFRGYRGFDQDITERKRVEASLLQSWLFLQSFVEHTPAAVAMLDRDLRYVVVSKRWYQDYQLSEPSIIGLHHYDVFPEIRGMEHWQAIHRRCLAGEILRSDEDRFCREDGRDNWLRWEIRPWVDESGSIGGIIMFTEDITERKRTEQESHERIRQSAAMQTALLELAHLDDISLTFSTILPHVTRIVADVLAVERVSLWLLSGDQTELVCQDLYLRSQATHSAGSRLAASSYPRYLAVLKESLVIGASNARVDQRTSEFADDYFLSLGITSVLDVPIRRQGKVIGVLWCEHVGMPREWASEVQDFGASVGQTIARMIEASERRRAEISLRQSEERYRSLVDNAPIGIFVIEAGRFVYANREMQRILNATRAEQLLGMPILDRIAPEFHTVLKDRIHQLIEKGQPVPSLDSKYVRLDGSRIDVAVTAIPTSFDGTDVIQVLVLDIAERKRGEQEQARLIEDLTRSQQHFQALFNWTPSAVGISTVAEGRFIDVNEGFSRLTGYMREEVIGRTTLELGLWADPSEREFALRKIQEQGYLHNWEGLLRTKSGEIRSLMVSVESIQLGSIPCLIYLCHDITERKRMEDALRTRERELQAALQERERISQDLHDGILQSLFGVGLNLEVTKSLMPQKTRKTASGSLDKSIDQLNRVMREIRNFIAGLGPDPIEGKGLQTALQSMLISLTENQPTRVRLAVEKRAVQAVSAEQSFHFFRVVQEAVSNCIRHGGAQEARVSLKMLKQGVRLSIRDNGRGFNPHVAKGVGHGLANMAARAKKIGGRFTVLSKENEGTRIILDLPKEAPHFPR